MAKSKSIPSPHQVQRPAPQTLIPCLPKPLSVVRSWRKGADLALALIEQCTGKLDEMALDDDCRDGRPQNNAVMCYLSRLRALNEPPAETAFCAVLTDYISCTQSCGTPDIAFLKKLSREPITTTAKVTHA